MEQILIVSSVLLWVVVLLNLLLTLALVRRLNVNPGEKLETLAIGQPAPDFAAETLRGETVTRATYAQRTVAFVFISPNCGHCRTVIPPLEALYPKARQSGVELVLVSDTDIAATQAYVHELAISLPILVAPRTSNPFLNTYKVGGVPFYYVVDAAGIVRSAGFPSDQNWRTITDSWAGNTIHTNQPQTAPA